MGNVIGEQFEEFVAQQINVRQKVHGSGVSENERTIENINYLNAKTSWVKLASGVYLTDERTKENKFNTSNHNKELAKNYVLSGGVSRLKEGDKKLTQRGEGLTENQNNINDYYTGAYNVSARSGNRNTDLDFGLVPMPGIESVEVKNLNRGSLKKAEIKIKAYSREQFEIIDALYLRLGYTMMLEWGNSIYLDNEGNHQSMGYTIIESPNGWFNDSFSKKTNLQILSEITGWRASKSGNYDALLAKVVNFNWSFNDDGSYDINLSLISLGDVIESMKINTTPPTKWQDDLKRLKVKYDEEVGKDTEGGLKDVSPADNIISAYLFLQKVNYLNSDTPSGDMKDITIKPNSGVKLPIGNWVIPSEGRGFEVPVNIFGSVDALDAEKLRDIIIKNLGEGANVTKGLLDYTQILNGAGTGIQLTLTHKVNIHIIGTKLLKPQLPESNSEKNVCYFSYVEEENNNINDRGFYIRFGWLLEILKMLCIPKVKGNDSQNEPQLNIDFESTENKMLLYPNQYSLDPRVCIVESSIRYWIDNTGFDLFKELAEWANYEKGYAHPMNIYVNFTTVQNAIDNNLDEEGNLNLFDFMSSICDDLNKALGGINNLEPIIEEETNTLKIIDSSFSADTKKASYGLEVFGYNPEFKSSNFVRNVDLKTAITKEYADMVTIGATAAGYVKGTEATMFSKWNKGYIDRFKEQYLPPTPEEQENLNDPIVNYAKNLLDNGSLFLGIKPQGIMTGWTTAGVVFELQDEAIDSNVAIGTEYYKWLNSFLYAKTKNDKEPFSSKINGFIPMNLSLTLDGISGIKIYNQINVSARFLPKNYPKSLKFLVTKVDHSLNNQDWETKIETVTIHESLDGKSKTNYDLLDKWKWGGIDNKLKSENPNPGVGTGTSGSGGVGGGSAGKGSGKKISTKELNKAKVRLKIERFLDDGKQTLGIMQIYNPDGTEKFELKSVELPYLGNKNNISCIPTGVYLVRPHYSSKHGRCFWVYGSERNNYIENQLPGNGYIRGAVLIHRAPNSGWLAGCIGPGTKFNSNVSVHTYVDKYGSGGIAGNVKGNPYGMVSESDSIKAMNKLKDTLWGSPYDENSFYMVIKESRRFTDKMSPDIANKLGIPPTIGK